jgi:PAS domain S-box-containing protein
MTNQNPVPRNSTNTDRPAWKSDSEITSTYPTNNSNQPRPILTGTVIPRNDPSECELNYLNLIEHCTDSVCLESDHRIERINRKFIDKFGPIAVGSDQNRSGLLSIVADSSRENVHRQRMSLLQQKSLFSRFEFSARDLNGEEIEVEASCSVIPYQNSTALLTILRDITEQKRSERIRDRQQKLVDALSEAASIVNSTLTSHEIMDRILASIGRVIPYDSANIMMIDEDCDTVRIVASRGYVALGLQGYQERITLSIRDTDSLNRIYTTQQPLVIADTSSVPGWINIPETSWIHSYLAAPVLVNEKVVGFLNINSPHPNRYTTEMAKNLMAFADQTGIALTNARLLDDLKKSMENLAKSYDITLEGWSKALELRDFETEGHSQRVVNLTVQLAARLGIHEPELTWLRYGVLLHDIGKIGIPDRILFKPGPLSDDEWFIMRRHTEFGLKILQPVPFLAPAIDIPYCHHEHWDGSGYPHGLKGSEIPQFARIFSIVDVWDGLRSIRPYHDSWSFEDAYQYISSQSGKQFDPSIVPVFLDLIREFKDIY